MSLINPQTKEINCKIVYYGPALSGKTSSMLSLQEKIRRSAAGSAAEKGVSGDGAGRLAREISTEERTLFFDFLALSSREAIKNYKVSFQVYTVPGQVLYEDARKLLLNGVDGIIFVADSRLEYVEDSLRSLDELSLNLGKLGYKDAEIPMVIQYNRRDAATAARVSDLSEVLNPKKHPEFESVAPKGKGVFETFQALAQKVMMDLKDAA